MLGDLLGNLYQKAISRVFGLDAIIEQKLPTLVRKEIDAAFLSFARGETGGRGIALDVEQATHFLAAVSSAEFVLEHMRMTRNVILAETLLKFALKSCAVDGLIMEFGVFRGNSLRIIADATTQPVFGFDSFEGLPEDWNGLQKQGQFSLAGVTPQFEQSNVTLVPGWFEHTLSRFLETHPGPARFIHVDSDIYSSAVTVLTALRERIVPGTVIQFDEYFNYAGWQHHEHKAFEEFIRDTGLKFEYLGYASSQCAVAMKIV